MTDQEYIAITATKDAGSLAGLTLRKQVRACSEHLYVSQMTADSIFVDTDLSVGDEILSIEVPVGAMNAVEVAQLIHDSEGPVTIVASRKPGKKSKLPGRSTKSEYVTATAHKPYRTTDAGLGFRRAVRKSGERIIVADIAEDSLFAETDLRLDDEVVSIEVGVDGRTANEVADIIRGCEGDITLFVVPRHRPLPSSSTRRHEVGHSKGGVVGSSGTGGSSSTSRWKVFSSRKKAAHVSPTNNSSSTSTGLTAGTMGTVEEF